MGYIGNFPGVGNLAFYYKSKSSRFKKSWNVIKPSNSFHFIQGFETLPLRMKKHLDNAKQLAEWLNNHPAIEWVNYTGFNDHPSYENCKKYLNNQFPSVFTFGVKGGYEAGKTFIESVKLASHLANVGDAKTLVIHPASTTHSQLKEEDQKKAGVKPAMIRVSVGLEHINDIKNDFDNALNIAIK